MTAIFGLSNFFFYFEADYFGVQASSRPLLHTWTLAVEEQFYLLWPLLLWALVKLPVLGRVLLIIVMIAASTAIGEYQLRGDPEAAFYLLPARVGELAMGGLVAVMMREYQSLKTLGQKTFLVLPLHLASLAFLVWAFFAYDGEGFPGLLALPPAIATALLLLFPVKGPFAALLTNSAARWIGLISYSAYLLHWPLLVFYEAWQLRSITQVEGLILIAVTLGLASLFYLYIEQPFRYKKGTLRRISNRAVGILASVSILALSSLAVMAWSSQSRIGGDNLVAGYTIHDIEAKRQAAFRERLKLVDANNCHQFSHEADTDFSHCLTLDPGKDNILVFGSSFAAGDGLMMKTAFPDANIQTLTVQGCLVTRTRYAKEYCRPVSTFVSENYDKINQFDIVVISHNWVSAFQEKHLRPFIDNITSPIVVLGPRGKLNTDSIKVLQGLSADDEGFASEAYLDKDEPILRERVSRISADNDMVYIDMYSILWENGALPLLVGEGELIYHDYGHYTPAGAAYVGQKFAQRFPRPDNLLSGPISPIPKLQIRKEATPELLELRQKRRIASQTRQTLVQGDGCHQRRSRPNIKFGHCLDIDSDKANILVIGNSFGAGDWLMLKAAYPEANVQKLTVQGCTPTYKVKSAHCSTVHGFISNNYDRINAFDLVIISQDWVDRFDQIRLDQVFERFIDNVSAPIVMFGPRGKISQNAFEILRRSDGDTTIELEDKFIEPSDLYNRGTIQAYAEQKGLSYVDMYDLLRTDERLPLLITPDQFLFYDHGHYTPAGAEYVGARFRARFPDPFNTLDN